MQTLETLAGDDIRPTIKKAISLAIKTGENVQFDFNGVTIVVDGNSIPELVYRDWDRAMIGCLGENPTIGPEYKVTLTKEEILSDGRIRNELDREIVERHVKHKEERQRKQLALKGVLSVCGPIKLVDSKDWQKTVDINQSKYGARVVRFAEEWARLMQVRIDNGYTVEECHEECADLADDDGITGNIYLMARMILHQAWVHGAELKAVKS